MSWREGFHAATAFIGRDNTQIIHSVDLRRSKTTSCDVVPIYTVNILFFASYIFFNGFCFGPQYIGFLAQSVHTILAVSNKDVCSLKLDLLYVNALWGSHC